MLRELPSTNVLDQKLLMQTLFSYQFHLRGSRKDLAGSIQPPLELPVIEMDFEIA